MIKSNKKALRKEFADSWFSRLRKPIVKLNEHKAVSISAA